METSPSILPDDVDALRAIIAVQADQLAEQARKLQSRDTLINKLKPQLAVLKRARFSGVLHADGYAGFRDLYEPNKPGSQPVILEAACWAHARRKFFDLTTSGKAPIAEEALRGIGELYDIERPFEGSRQTCGKPRGNIAALPG